MKSVLEKYFNSESSHVSQVIPEFERVVEVDEDGNEYTSYIPLDTKKIIESNGKVSDWQLDALLKAGINPESFSIHTASSVSRLEGAGTVSQIEKDLDSILNEGKE